MKKLFVAALAAVAMVGAANAVNLRWQLAGNFTITKHEETKALDTSKYTAYLYRNTGNEAPSIASGSNLKIPDTCTFVESSTWDSKNNRFGNMSNHPSTFDADNHGWLIVLVESSISQESLESGIACYAAVVTGNTNYQKAGSGSMSISSTTGADVSWYGEAEPTPEPTSGLLVLIGMGALALKRRRA